MLKEFRYKKMAIPLGFCFFILSIFLPSYAKAQESIGKFASLQGSVDVLRGGALPAVPVKVGDPVFVKDIIRTKSGAKAEILFNDGNILKIAQRSRVDVSEYVTETKGVFKLQRGKVEAIVEQKTVNRISISPKTNRFEIHTPNAVAGVRGSDYFVFHDRNLTGVVVKSGAIYVYNPKFPDVVVVVTPGNSTITPPDKPPEPPKPVTDAEMKGHEKDVTPITVEKPKVEIKPVEETPLAGILPTLSSTPPAPEVLSPPTPTTPEPPPTPPITETIPEKITEIPTDTKPPVVKIETAAIPVPGTSESTVLFNLSSDESATYSYRYDGGEWTSASGTVNLSLEVGDHFIDYKATDSAGNTSPINSLSFNLNRYYLTEFVHNTSAFELSGNATGDIAAVLNQDWGGWIIVNSGTSGTDPSGSFHLLSGGEDGSGGYWLSKMDVDASDDFLSGTSNLTHLTETIWGTGTGMVLGTYGDGSWEATDQGFGTYSSTPLAFGGTLAGKFFLWDIDALLEDGWIEGLMGGMENLWSGNPSFVSLGRFSNPSNRSLWGVDIGTDTSGGWSSNQGAFVGSMGGIVLDSTLEGRLLALYVRDTGETGYIYSDDVAGIMYPEIGMYELSGKLNSVPIGLTAVPPSAVNWESPHLGSAEGEFDIGGNIVGKGMVQTLALLESAGNPDSAQPWGIWRMGSGGTYAVTPAPDWKAFAGGEIFDEGEVVAYWLGNILGKDWSSNRLNGDISGRFMNLDRKGEFVGEILGIYKETGGSGSWQALGLGIYTEEPLEFSGKLIWGRFGFSSGGSQIWDDNSSLESFLGGTKSLWSGSSPVDFLGTYSNPFSRTLWDTDISGTTTNDGKFYISMGGINLSNKLEGRGIGLYIRPKGSAYEAGYLTSNPSNSIIIKGDLYPDIKMWEASGNIKAIQMGVTTIPPEQLYWGSPSLDVTWGSGDIRGDMTGPIQIESLNLKDQNWGRWMAWLDGLNTPPSNKWTAKMGGGGSFGKYTPDGGIPQCDSGYWIASITGNRWEDGKFDGELTGGDFITKTELGEITGDLIGTYDTSTWQAVSLGSWEGVDLAFRGWLLAIPSYFGGSNDGFDMVGDGYMQGAFGGTQSLWLGTKPIPVTMIGEYEPGVNPQIGRIWSAGVNSFNYLDATSTTYDGGAFSGYLGGTTLRDSTTEQDAMEAKFITLYMTQDQQAGFLKGSLNGKGYPNILMFEMDGTIERVEMENGIGIGNPKHFIENISQMSFHAENNVEFKLNGIDMGAEFNRPYEYGGEYSNIDNLKGKEWGIWNTSIGGSYSSLTITDSWSAFIEFNDSTKIFGQEIVGSKWSDNKIVGTTIGYGADITSTPKTWISVGETIGTFDANSTTTFQMISMGPWIETRKFLGMANSDAGKEALKKLNIPCVEVGVANLSGSGNHLTVSMNDVKFFAPNNGDRPSIWATGNVNGTYTNPPALNVPVTITGNGLSANFNVKTWDIDNKKWLSTITNASGTLAGHTATYDNLKFNGAGAGTMRTGANGNGGTFTGTAAGVAK